MKHSAIPTPLTNAPSTSGASRVEVVILTMRDERLGDVEGLNQFFPGAPVEIEHGLVLLHALFFDLGDFTRLRWVYFIVFVSLEELHVSLV